MPDESGLLVASCKYRHKCAAYVDVYNDLRRSLEKEGLSKEAEEEKIRKRRKYKLTDQGMELLFKTREI